MAEFGALLIRVLNALSAYNLIYFFKIFNID